MATSGNEIAALVDSILAGGSAPASRLAVLSDLDGARADQLRAEWARLSIIAKVELLAQSTELAGDNVDLDFTQLARIGLRDDSAEVRVLAVEALWESTDRHVARDLTLLFRKDPDESVRAAAAASLGQFVLLRELDEFNAEQGDEIVEALRIAAGGAESSLDVRARALESLGPRALPWVAGLITEAYYDEEPTLRLAAVVAMGGTADDQWLDYLIEQLHSDDPEFRFHAASSLGVIASQDAVESLAEALDDDDSDVQIAVIVALGEIGGPEAVRCLKDFRLRAPPGLDEAVEIAIEAASFAAQPGGVEDESEDDEP
jgi:HEAT repeat protein